ncbi:MAG: hypothetical protein IJB66_06060, partial [Oscillospiraceae bacterium]|nr:hypothetical protein [Oscillospiraceae bacterium]
GYYLGGKRRNTSFITVLRFQLSAFNFTLKKESPRHGKAVTPPFDKGVLGLLKKLTFIDLKRKS